MILVENEATCKEQQDMIEDIEIDLALYKGQLQKITKESGIDSSKMAQLYIN